MKKIILFSVWCLCYSVVYSQDNQLSGFTLEECIAIAIENNLDIKNSKLTTKSSKINYRQSKNELLPSLNINYNLGLNNGRSIDPFTNNYSNQELTFSNLRMNLSLTIFNGFRLLNSIKLNGINLEASIMELEEVKQNLILNVTIGYIQILNTRDIVKLTKTRLETTEKQLNRLKAYYNEGLGNPVEFTNMQGQYAADQVAIINAENNYKSAFLDFINLLNLDSSSEKTFKNVSGIIETKQYPFSATDVYNKALENLAAFKSRQLRIDAANTGLKITKSDYFPEIFLFGQLNTNYSSLAETFTQTGTSISETGDFITIDSQDYSVLQNEGQFISDKINYTDQLNNNLNTVIGISLSIPLFNSFNNKNNVKLQKIKIEISKLELENTKQLFKQSIAQAYNNMESAYRKHQVLLNQVTAFKESYRINEIRFDNGVSNSVEYLTSKNNIDTAQLNLNNAKYEYLLRVKILDYYSGEQLF